MGLTGDSVAVLEEIPKFYFYFVAVNNLHTHTQWSGTSPEVLVLFLRNLTLRKT